MSQLYVDAIKDRAGSGGPTLGTGVTVNGGANLNVSGVITATTFTGDVTGDVTGNASGTAGGLSGTPSITVASITGTASTLSGITKITNNTSATSTSTGALVVTGGVGIGGDVWVGAGMSIAGTLTYEDVTNVDSVGLITAKSGVNVTGGQLTVGSGVTIGAAGIATFSAGVDFNGGSILKEKVNIVAGKASDNTNINLSYGQVWHFTTVETANFVPNIMSNTGINTSMEIGDTISVSIATSCAAVSWAATVTVDGAAVNEQKWGGGSAPTEGGSSGHDLYTHNIMKTAANTYTVLSNVTNFG